MSDESPSPAPSGNALAELISTEAEYTRRVVVGLVLVVTAMLIAIALPILDLFLEGPDEMALYVLPGIFATVSFGIGVYLFLSTSRYEDRIKELRKHFGIMQPKSEESADQKA